MNEIEKLIERLRGYNPPDRTIDEQRQMAQDIHDAADALTAQQGRVPYGSQTTDAEMCLRRILSRLKAGKPLDDMLASIERFATQNASPLRHSAAKLAQATEPVAAQKPEATDKPSGNCAGLGPASAAAPDLELPEPQVLYTIGQTDCIAKSDYDALLSLARKLKERVEYWKQHAQQFNLDCAVAREKLAEAEREITRLKEYEFMYNGLCK